MYFGNIKFQCLPGSKDSGVYSDKCILLKYRTFYFNSYSEGEGHLKTLVMISCSLFIIMHTICMP